MDRKTTVTLDSRMAAAGLAPVDAAELQAVEGGLAPLLVAILEIAGAAAVGAAAGGLLSLATIYLSDQVSK